MALRILFVSIFLITAALADDKCVYKTEQIIEDGNVVKIIEHKSCVETQSIGNKSFWANLTSQPGYENTLMIVLMTIVEHL